MTPKSPISFSYGLILSPLQNLKVRKKKSKLLSWRNFERIRSGGAHIECLKMKNTFILNEIDFVKVGRYSDFLGGPIVIQTVEWNEHIE